MTTERDVRDAIDAGRQALLNHAWREAYDLLSSAHQVHPLQADELADLSQAAYWSGHLNEMLGITEGAYAAYVAAGDSRGAARMALDLFGGFHQKMQLSIAAGWLRSAERLLEHEPECREHGLLLRHGANASLTAHDYGTAYAQSTALLDLGTRLKDRDLIALGVHEQGRALLAQGRADEGLALLEEATAAAVAGDLEPYSTAVIYCNIIQACRDMLDFRRAGEWTDAATRWCERQSMAGFPGVCRIHRAEIMRLRGHWVEAEEEARRACDELQDFAINVINEGFYQIGEIRLRMGDLTRAEDAFRQAHEMGREPQPGMGLLHLARGRPDAAASALKRSLEDESWGLAGRARILPAYIEAAIAAGDVAGARAVVPMLQDIATSFGTVALDATLHTARGAVELAEGDADAAARSLRRALQLWQQADAPYEAACARVTLARAHDAQADPEAASLELDAAKAAFDRLGAVLDTQRAAALLAGIRRGVDAARPQPLRLTRTFMFTDIVKSTDLVEAMGDEAWAEVLRWHDAALESLVAANCGDVIDHTGDGFFVAFDTSAAAVACAVAIQRRLAEHRREHGFAPAIRIGLHASEALQSGANYRGKGVHQAQRIAALGHAGDILASDCTVDEVEVGVTFSEPRIVTLRGIKDPVKVMDVRWRQP